MRLKKIILPFLFAIFGIFTIQAQLSKKHYIPPLTSDSNDPVTIQYIYISTPSNTNVPYRIIPMGSPNIEAYSGVVSNENPVEQPVLTQSGTSADESQNSQLHIPILNIGNVIRNKGFIIEADDLIYVSIRVRSSIANDGVSRFQAGALVSKGSSALGTAFRIGGFRTEENVIPGHATFASMMATEDGTNVTIDDLPPGITLVNYSGSFPIEIQLNEGESYVLASSSNIGGDPKDLIGGLISSDKPIAVNIGSATGSFGQGLAGRDYGFDQIVGADRIGTDYILVRGDGSNPWENVLIIAHENNTEIFVNNETTARTILNAGQSFVLEGNNYVSNNMYVNSTKPVFVYQGIGGLGPSNGPEEPNQGLFFVPPLSCESVGNVNNIAFIDQVDESGDVFRGGVTIVTNVGANIEIRENGEPITLNVLPTNVSGNEDYVTYRVTGLSGNISVSSDRELYCAYFNGNGFASTGAFYSGFLSPEIEFNNSDGSSGSDIDLLGNCIPNVVLEVTNVSLLENFEWQYFNEITKDWETRSTDTNYQPIVSEPGRYRVIGNIECTGSPFESPEVIVSVCPDDFDGDQIMDNLDIDIDNDGILNIDESLGDVIIDISDINNPVLNFNNGVTDNTFTSSTVPSDLVINSFEGDNNGGFSSTIGAGASDSNIYKLSFNSPVSFKVTQRENFPHVANNNNYFILKVEPNNKNITLLDPDNQIEVDTDFDGSFDDEFDVSQITASEIRFRFKESLSPNEATYQFIANNIESISFEHQYGGADSSTFHGNIILTNFTKDTDNDGVSDDRDLDSDNDGIPDSVEHYNQIIQLTSNDNNSDGLDDAFENFSEDFNIDSDEDEVPNALDLDSDNDGIYDIIEAGLASIHNSRGQINGLTQENLGENGWFNNLETEIDSGLLNFVVIDSNDDSVFDFLSLDSDGDSCFDVTEAGFSGNDIGRLLPDPLSVDENGKVLNSDGYGSPNMIYVQDGTITYTIAELVEICENNGGVITLESNADSFQWELSTDNGENWSLLRNDDTYDGVETNALSISNVDLSFDNNLYRVLLNRDTYGCEDIITTPVNVTISPLPNIILESSPFRVSINECISELIADTNPTISLRGVESLISDTDGAIFRYYTSPTAAEDEEIEDPDNYPFTINQRETFYIKVFSASECENPAVIQLDVNVGFADPEIILPGVKAVECDDELEGISSDTDFMTQFSLDAQAIENEIKANLNTENVLIEYYESLQDRTSAINQIDITNFRNNISKNDTINVPTGIQFPIYFKLISTVNNACEGLGFFNIQIDAVPEANPLADLEFCDDLLSGSSTDGINVGFNLRERVSEILGPNQTENDFNVSFHTSYDGARTNTDHIENDEDYANQAPNPFDGTTINEQEIFVRVESKSGLNCYNANTSFKIKIYPLPKLPETVDNLIVCDFPTIADPISRNRIAQNIDLTVKTDEILEGRTGFQVVYFVDEISAQNLENIENPDDFSSIVGLTDFPLDLSTDEPGIQRIYYRVIDESGIQCPSLISSFELHIYPEPAISPIAPLLECDNDNDGDDTNGIIQSIDLDSKIEEILNGRNPEDYENITFHLSAEDAETGTNPIISPYQNTNPEEQIFVRLQQKISGCINSNESFQLIINPLPDFTVTSPQIICLNDLPYTIGVENPQAAYNYLWTDDNGNEISTNEEAEIEKGGTYLVTATNPITNCVRIDSIVVNESNVATLEEKAIVIVDDLNNGGNSSFSIAIDTINFNLGIGDYQFALLNNDNNERIPFAGYQEEPFFELVGGGIYTVIVNDRNGCVPDTELTVSVIEFPKFFTPNADGINDYWRVKGASLDFFPNGSINIFNRFGKLVAKVPIDSEGWDGTYQGNLLPSDDYWYKINLVPADTNDPPINRTSHFSLLRGH